MVVKCLALFKKYSIRNLNLRLDLLSKLRHPHLVCLLGHCVDGSSDDSSVNRVYLIYEYIPNGNLHSHLSGTYETESFQTCPTFFCGFLLILLIFCSD